MFTARHIRAAVFSLFFSAMASVAWAGPYASGTTGLSYEDSSIVEWASEVVSCTRGPVDSTNSTGATASFGDLSNALGQANCSYDSPYNVVSLGDGGSITLSFANPIFNGAGADFAVYENAFKITGTSGLYFCELAFVEVSSDGENFFRFPSISLTQTTTQIGGFGGLDPTNIYDLAGKNVSGIGTEFDLSELADISALLDINNVKYVRVIDVVGTLNTAYGATYDSLGNLINDPWKTNFNTGGFDLDAVGVINAVPEPSAALLLLGLPALRFLRRSPLKVHRAI